MKRLKVHVLFGVALLIGMGLGPVVGAQITPNTNFHATLGNDEEAFTFTGKCPNGDKYRLVSYQTNISGVRQSFYEYEGPAGIGKVSSEASPKTMSVRVCRHLAEIINQNYWE